MHEIPLCFTLFFLGRGFCLETAWRYTHDRQATHLFYPVFWVPVWIA